MYQPGSQRFTLLLLEEKEDYVADFNAFCKASAALGTAGNVHGKLRVCTKSIFFDSDDVSIPILRVPFSKVVGCTGTNEKQFAITTPFYTTCKKDGLNRPYMHRFLDNAVTVLVTLEFASMDALMPQLMQVLEISKEPNLTVRDQLLQEFARQQAARFQFDYRRLNDEFNERVLKECRVRHLTPLVRQPGILVVTNLGIYFQPLHNITGEAVVRFQPVQSIACLARRHFASRPVALEMFFLESSWRRVRADQRWTAASAMFMLDDQETREEVHTLLTQMPTLGADVKGGSALQRGALLEGRGAWLLHVQSAWIHGRVSNLEYLLYLNFAAGRSFNDLAQWPVFPWILADYESSELHLDRPETFRDLSKPMGALGHPQRLQEARQRFMDTNEFYVPEDPCSDPGYMYGSHYSTPGYVMYWLVRKTPEQMLRLQNGRFDSPDRLFFSVGESWKSSTGRSNTDVKELIPEFFLAGDGTFLLNTKNLPLGRRQNGEAVADVKLPAWAEDAADFIWKHRQALESEYVQRNLHSWIDLIFGCKQKGEAALQADNLFRHTSYEGAHAMLDAITDPVERVAKEMMISEFGQTPAQLFDEGQPHPPRQVITPTPTAVMDGYCSQPASGEHVSHALVHILLEVSSSETMRSVLAASSLSSSPAKPLPPSQSDFALKYKTANAQASFDGGQNRAPLRRPSTDQHQGSASRRSSLGKHQVVKTVFSSANLVTDKALQGVAGVRSLFAKFGSGSRGPAARQDTEGRRSNAGRGGPTEPAGLRSTATCALHTDAASAHGLGSMAMGAAEAQSTFAPQMSAPAALDTASAALSSGSSSALPVPPSQHSERSPQCSPASSQHAHPALRGSEPVVANSASTATGSSPASFNSRISHAAPSMSAVSAAPMWPSRLHDLVEFERRLDLERETVSSLAAAHGTLIIGSAAGVLHAYDTDTLALRCCAKLPRACPISSIIVLPVQSPSAPLIALAGTYSKVHAFSLSDGAALGSFEAHADTIAAMAWGARPGANGGSIFYTAGDDAAIRGWPVDAGSAPWTAVVPPLLELDLPDGSIPTCLQAHFVTGALLVGTSSGQCVIYDPSTGVPTWQYQAPARINSLSMLPGPDLKSVVVAADDQCLRLLDLRRQGDSAVLSYVTAPERVRGVVSDGCCALAGTQSSGLLLWNLDPASEQTEDDRRVGIISESAGLGIPIQGGSGGQGPTMLVAVTETEAHGWLIASAQSTGVDLFRAQS